MTDAAAGGLEAHLRRQAAQAALWTDCGGSQVDAELALLHVAAVDHRAAERLVELPRDLFTGPARTAIYDAEIALRKRDLYAPFDPASLTLAVDERVQGLSARHVVESLSAVKADPQAVETYVAALLDARFGRLAPGLRESAAKALMDDDMGAHAARMKELAALLPTRDDASEEPAWLANRWLTVGEWGIDRDWLDTAPPLRDFVMYRYEDGKSVGFLAAGIVGLLIGAGGRGKSWLFVLLALSIATGRSFIEGFVVEEPGDVLLVFAEEDAEELWRRLHHGASLLDMSEDERSAVRRRIVVLPARGQDVGLQSRDGDRRQGGSLQDAADAGESPFARALFRRLNRPGRRWRLVVLDPLARFAGMDAETDNAEATRFIEILERITMVPGNPATLGGHHVNKASRDGGTSASASRGSGALTDGARWVANLDGGSDPETEEDMVVLHLSKTNYTPPAPKVVLYRDSEHGGALRRATEEVEDRVLAAAEKNKGRKGRETEKKPSGEVRDRQFDFDGEGARGA